MPASQADSAAFGAVAGAPQDVAGHARIDDIQVLRAAAIACVLVQHSCFNLVFHQLWLAKLLHYAPLACGVDLFFVISGYVITRSLLPAVLAAGSARQVLARFWIRRAFRIWPAAWLWLALIVLGSLVFTNPPFLGTLALNLRGALAGLFAYANFRFASRPFMPYGASYPFWSLSLEEQFYVLLPPVMLLARQRIVWVAVAALVIQLPLAHPRLYYFLRNDGLVWGVLLASAPMLSRAATRAAESAGRFAWAGWLILAAAIATMSYLSPMFEETPPFMAGEIAAAAAVPVWLASANRNLLTAGRLQPALMWLGSRSYALYLCHVPIYQCASAMSRAVGAGHADLLSVGIALPLLGAAAEGTYRLCEQPLRKLGIRLSRAHSTQAAGQGPAPQPLR